MRDAPLSYSVVAGRNEGTTVVQLTGPLTLSTMFPLQQELRSLKPQVLILDMAGVPYMDSAGLGLIPNYYVPAARDGRRMLLVGVNPRVGALLNLTKIDALIPAYPTAEEAEAAL